MAQAAAFVLVMLSVRCCHGLMAEFQRLQLTWKTVSAKDLDA